MRRLLSLVGMLALLLMASGLDRIWEALRVQNSRTFNVTPSIWFAGTLDLVFAGSVLALAWFFLSKAEKSYLASGVFAFVGTLLLISYPMRAAMYSIPRGSTFGALFQILAVPPAGYLFHAAAFVAVIGAAGWVRAIKSTHAGTTLKPADST